MEPRPRSASENDPPTRHARGRPLSAGDDRAGGCVDLFRPGPALKPKTCANMLQSSAAFAGRQARVGYSAVVMASTLG